ncbi:MAG TPA: peptidyl-tRNA hydrolase [Candidatus Wolfebacteria bacterium]|nr:peptidyl-tRNA hydrolase [Candidatus Wolfebacteria bacterium]
MKIKLIIGLGNPDFQHILTYHNVGQLFLSWLIEHEAWNIKHKLFIASKFKIHDSQFIIHVIKSSVFMNESGKAVLSAIKYFSTKDNKIDPKEILIVHDDSDIELEKYKFSYGRGSAGHKGIESIIKSLKTKNFWRLRIGIRPKQVSRARRAKAGEFVLKKITKKDLTIFNKVFQSAQAQLFNTTTNK